MNLDPNQSLRHSRQGKQAAAVRDGRHQKGNAPTEPIDVLSPVERMTAVILALDDIRPECAGDAWVKLEIPRSLWSDLRAAVAALKGN